MISKFKNSVVGKIMSGYGAVILLAFITTLVSMYTAWQNHKMDKVASEAYYPMLISLKQIETLASESYQLTNNWIYQPSLQEKEKLKEMHNTTAKEQIGRFNNITDKLDNEAAIEEAKAITEAITQLLKGESRVMEKLSTGESYGNDLVVDEVITTMDKDITPNFKKVDNLVNQAFTRQNELLVQANVKKEAYSKILTYLYVGNIILFVLIGIYASYFSIRKIAKPIADLSELITKVSQGKFVTVTLQKGKDEIARMGEAIQNMLTGLKAKVEFAENIGKGNYNSQFELLSDEDTMGEALIKMRDNLNQAAEDDRKRNWATEGLAKFADILRSRSENISELSDSIISNLVNYMKASQGALFLINDDNTDDPFIELVACFAYNRKKYLNKRIEMGEGITGQCILEKDTIYLSDIPENYMRITSGLGEALPRNLLIVPLKLDEAIFGVVEIGFFQTIAPHQTEFMQKLGESIASAISSVKVNSRTKKLLEETQVQAEQMRAQEEEMRQNMEELSATQEEMQRVLQAAQSKEEYLNEVLNSSKDSMCTIDKSFKLISFNKAFGESLRDLGFHAEKDMEVLDVYRGKKREKQRSYYHRALAGEHFEVIESSTRNEQEVHTVNTYSPLKNEKDEVYAIVCFSKDITEMVQAKHRAEKAATEAQQITEEMKSQEEELRQNMEELSATQEEMQKVMDETQNRERYLMELINLSTDAIFTMDREFKVLEYNTYFAKKLKDMGVTVKRGFDVLSLFTGEERELNRKKYERVFAGECLEHTDRSVINGNEIYLASSYSPMRDKKGGIVAIASFTKDITDLMVSKKKQGKALEVNGRG